MPSVRRKHFTEGKASPRSGAVWSVCTGVVEMEELLEHPRCPELPKVGLRVTSTGASKEERFRKVNEARALRGMKESMKE